MAEKYKLHNVRLDDEVWAAVKALDCSLNQYLRRALLERGEVLLKQGFVKEPKPINVRMRREKRLKVIG